MDALGRLTPEAYKQLEKIPLIVVLDNIRSMHNVGSIFRSADAFRIEAIFLCGYTPQPPHRDIHKTALGATETVAWQHFANIEQALQSLQEKQYSIAAIEQTSNSMQLQQWQWDGKPLAVVFGNEVEGVQPAALPYCSMAVEIPQFGTKHSLNVSVAAGIILWHIGGQSITNT